MLFCSETQKLRSEVLFMELQMLSAFLDNSCLVWLEAGSLITIVLRVHFCWLAAATWSSLHSQYLLHVLAL